MPIGRSSTFGNKNLSTIGHSLETAWLWDVFIMMTAQRLHLCLRFWCCVIVSNLSDDCSLSRVLSSISTLTGEWFNLGLALGLSNSTLNTIEHNNPRDARRCLTEMVNDWLHNSQPSWRQLVSALRSPLVNRIDIANIIATQHPSH